MMTGTQIFAAVVSGIAIQFLIAVAVFFLSAARLRGVVDEQMKDLAADVHEIKQKLGNGGGGVFLRMDLAKELFDGLKTSNGGIDETIKILRERSHDQANMLTRHEFELSQAKEELRSLKERNNKPRRV